MPLKEDTSAFEQKEGCKICGDLTQNRYNINFKATPICEDCATAIFIQQANWYVQESKK